ncbi:DUF6880 family protein [Kineococcus sp. R86509]|uniref:DUF6880 family protein n=1 Tax=Kineococcus sp. R86509 TaxID=3093851 RepID=UPI0036D2B129
MSDLADAVLPLLRTRADLHRWSSANAHGRQMHDAVDRLEAAVPDADPHDAWTVTHKALASAVTIIARADDSSGIIGDACRRLLDLHPRVAQAASVPVSTLVPWLIRFQFEGEVDYFELDPVAYAPALGELGTARYRAALAEIRATVGPPPDVASWPDPHRRIRWVLEWNDRRLAVLDRDVEGIVRTHARDQRVAAWLQDTAEAMEEIGRIDLALDWARRAVDHDHGHQSLTASRYWLGLITRHRPEETLEAVRYVFHRWPTASTAAALREAAGATWSRYEAETFAALATSAAESVSFCLNSLADPVRAWKLAEELGLTDSSGWSALAAAYETVDPLAVLPVHRRLVTEVLTETDARQYREAARRLARMRRLAAGTVEAAAVEEFVAELRVTHRRRPRLQQEFDRVGLPR